MCWLFLKQMHKLYWQFKASKTDVLWKFGWVFFLFVSLWGFFVCFCCFFVWGGCFVFLLFLFFFLFFCLENPKTNLIGTLTPVSADFRNWSVVSRHNLSFATYFSLAILMHQNLLLTDTTQNPNFFWLQWWPFNSLDTQSDGFRLIDGLHNSDVSRTGTPS